MKKASIILGLSLVFTLTLWSANVEDFVDKVGRKVGQVFLRNPGDTVNLGDTSNPLVVRDVNAGAVGTSRTYVILYATQVAVGAGSEAVLTINSNKGGTVATGLSQYSVTAGKTFRIQQISVSSNMSAAENVRVRLRADATTVSTSSQILWANILSTDLKDFTGMMTAPHCEVSIPDGLEIAAAQKIGFTGIAGAGSSLDITIIGYEY